MCVRRVDAKGYDVASAPLEVHMHRWRVYLTVTLRTVQQTMKVPIRGAQILRGCPISEHPRTAVARGSTVVLSICFGCDTHQQPLPGLLPGEAARNFRGFLESMRVLACSFLAVAACSCLGARGQDATWNALPPREDDANLATVGIKHPEPLCDKNGEGLGCAVGANVLAALELDAHLTGESSATPA